MNKTMNAVKFHQQQKQNDEKIGFIIQGVIFVALVLAFVIYY